MDGEPTGSVRVSFGYSSTYDDADRLLNMIQECFVNMPMTVDLNWLSKDGLIQINEAERELGGKEELREKDKMERKTGERGRMERKLREEGRLERKFKEEDRMEKKLRPEGRTARKLEEEEQMKKEIDVIVQEGKRREDITNNNSDNSTTDMTCNGNDNYNNTLSLSLSCTSTTSTSSLTPTSPLSHPHSTHTLTDIVVYPVKSCGGVQVSAWELGGTGLSLDRHWMVVSAAGATLTQKRLPRMALILPRLDLQNREMVLTCEGK